MKKALAYFLSIIGFLAWLRFVIFVLAIFNGAPDSTSTTQASEDARVSVMMEWKRIHIAVLDNNACADFARYLVKEYPDEAEGLFFAVALILEHHYIGQPSNDYLRFLAKEGKQSLDGALEEQRCVLGSGDFPEAVLISDLLKRKHPIHLADYQ